MFHFHFALCAYVFVLLKFNGVSIVRRATHVNSPRTAPYPNSLSDRPQPLTQAKIRRITADRTAPISTAGRVR